MRRCLGWSCVASCSRTQPALGEFRGGRDAARSACRRSACPPREGPLPLSFAQQRLWFLEQLEGSARPTTCPSGCACEGRWTVEALERALDAMVARHEALRTTFVEVDGDPVQRIAAEAAAAALAVLDLARRRREAEA